MERSESERLEGPKWILVGVVCLLTLLTAMVWTGMLHPSEAHLRALRDPLWWWVAAMWFYLPMFTAADAALTRRLIIIVWAFILAGGAVIVPIALMVLPQAQWGADLLRRDEGRNLDVHPRDGWRFRAALPRQLRYVVTPGETRWVPALVDDQGFRVTPQAALLASDTTVIYVGDSFCAGSGVTDTQTIAAWSAVLQPHVRWLNHGVSGWGFSQAFTHGTELIEQRASRPEGKLTIVHLVITDDIVRSNHDMTYLGAQNDNRKLPNLLLAGDDDLVRRGLIGVAEAEPTSHKTQLEGMERVRRTVVQLHKRSRAAGIKYLLVLLPEREAPAFASTFFVRRIAAEHRVPFLDLGEMPTSRDEFQSNRHPNGVLFRRIARRILEHPFLQ